MPYLVHHHGAFWFQIRVPAKLESHYGPLIRQNLQTTDRATAQQIAFQLAAQWMGRFSIERVTGPSTHIPEQYPAPLGVSNETPFDFDELPEVVTTISTKKTAIACKPAAQSTQNDINDTIESLHRYWKQLHPECSASTYKEVKSVVSQFKKVISKRPSQLERIDIARYRDKLIALRLSHATVAKKVSFISTILQTAYDAGFLAQNVARSLRIPKPKITHERRRAFTGDELKRIFDSPVFSQGKRYAGGAGEAAVWVPMIALVTGARLEEICQLRADDILFDDKDEVFIKISDEREDQRVKTVSSRRTVPIHRDLINAGFIGYLDYIKDNDQDWLFPSLEPDHDGRRGGNYSKWFSRYLRAPRGCGIQDQRVVFHSFRHSFKTLCREANLTEEIHDALTGHTSASVGRNYGSVPLSTLAKAVNQIIFPITLPVQKY